MNGQEFIGADHPGQAVYNPAGLGGRLIRLHDIHRRGHGRAGATSLDLSGNRGGHGDVSWRHNFRKDAVFSFQRLPHAQESKPGAVWYQLIAAVEQVNGNGVDSLPPG